jgi:hypothetical protein
LESSGDDLEEIAQGMGVGEAICTKREVVAVVDRPQDIEDEEAMAFFGGGEGDADESQGQIDMCKKPRDWSRGMLCFQFEGVCVKSGGCSCSFLLPDFFFGAEPVFQLVTVLPTACLIEFVRV